MKIPGAQHTLSDVQRLMNESRFAAALPLLANAAPSCPNDAQLHYLLGVCQLRTGSVASAIRSLRKSIGIKSQAEAIAQLGLAYRLANKAEDAADAIARGLVRHPAHPALVHASIDMRLSAGEHAEALDEIERLGEKARSTIEIRMLEAHALLGLGRAGDALAVIERIKEGGSLGTLSRVNVLHREGDILDKLGEYERAFASYSQANDANPAVFDPAALKRKADALIGSWTEEKLESLRARAGKSELAVFIVGMPRSGTTLVEQIIASHPNAFGGGERVALNGIVRDMQQRVSEPSDVLVSLGSLRDRSIERAGREYLRETRQLDKAAARITDKLPSNFRHIGLIASSMPAASIVHTERGPLDTALSCFFQNFGSTNTWSCDPKTIGAQHREYRRLMDHWHSIGIDILSVKYESMVSQQEAQTRRLLEHIGLGWDDACLRFYESGRVAMTASNEQVRKPMYTGSVSRHKKYAPYIARFVESLALDMS